MIRVEPECYPCFLDQVLRVCRHGNVGERETLECLKEASRFVGEAPSDIAPARVATRLHALVRDKSGVDDPYREVKERAIESFPRFYEMAKERVFSAPDVLKEALILAGAGNMFDFGLVPEEEAESFFEKASLSTGTGFDYEGFVPALEEADHVGILMDNTGEAPFDVLLAEVLRERGVDVWLGVKGGPVIDDLTYEEAKILGITNAFEVISNGSRGVGTLLEDTSPRFREAVERSDLIVSKGQANFETLWGSSLPCMFLFVVKCPVIERVTEHPYGEILLTGNKEDCGRSRLEREGVPGIGVDTS